MLSESLSHCAQEDLQGTFNLLAFPLVLLSEVQWLYSCKISVRLLYSGVSGCPFLPVSLLFTG